MLWAVNQHFTSAKGAGDGGFDIGEGANGIKEGTSCV